MPPGPQNVPFGGDAVNYGLDIPQTETPVADIRRETNMARFSKSKEFKALKDIILARIEYHRQFSPGTQGETAFRDMPNEERGWRTLAADLLISELYMLIDAYETANEIVDDAKEIAKRRQRTQSSTS